jgi:hypothetical protein
VSRVVWRGPQVAARARRAQIVGINKTTGECVTSAKGLVHVDTATLQGSIRLEPARADGNGARGQWGSFDVNYALWQEVLPRGRGGKPYLRPSADANYPHLAGHIRAAL